MLGVCFAIIDDEDDKYAFEKLYNKYNQRCYAIAYRILENELLAEDACADAFLQIAKSFQKINKLDAHKLDYYIVITIKNISFNILKKERKHSSNLELKDEIVSLSDKVLENIDYSVIVEAIKKLSDTDREIMYMRVFLGLDFKEISISLGISSGTARKRMEHSKKVLRILLDKEGILL